MNFSSMHSMSVVPEDVTGSLSAAQTLEATRHSGSRGCDTSVDEATTAATGHGPHTCNGEIEIAFQAHTTAMARRSDNDVRRKTHEQQPREMQEQTRWFKHHRDLQISERYISTSFKKATLMWRGSINPGRAKPLQRHQ